ncbi:MAG TPA: NAD(P)-dependent oxidoreductase [Stellaceae bacterium]|nr:NAD(P)-dependent oxidoreductase [Stellaceae bacterium]
MKTGIIGVGIMGSAIARNLVGAGMPVLGFDIAPARQKELGAMGATAARSAEEVAKGAEIILTSLPSIAALDATAQAIRSAAAKGTVVAEISTLPIDAKERARDMLAAAGVTLLDCPLSGTGAQAVTRDLVVFASGERQAVERCSRVFDGFARLTEYLGAFGNGSKMKYVANLLVAIHNVATAEAMVLGVKAGLAPGDIVKVIASGAGNSRVFELRAPLMAKNDYLPATMKIDIWQKDMAVIGEFAKSLGVALPTFAATVPVYNAAIGLGRGAEDTAAVCAVLEAMAGAERRT